MNKDNLSRRKFIARVSAGTAAVAAATAVPGIGNIITPRTNGDKLAILGGTPVAKGKVWPKWPYVDEHMVDEIVKTTRSGIWCRIQSPNGTVPTFEKEFAKLMGVNNSVTTGAGTQALNTCVEALGIGPGDEIITSPYTDPGTIQSILVSRALPVMADLDPESFQLDPADVEKKITKNSNQKMEIRIFNFHRRGIFQTRKRTLS